MNNSKTMLLTAMMLGLTLLALGCGHRRPVESQTGTKYAEQPPTLVAVDSKADGKLDSKVEASVASKIGDEIDFAVKQEVRQSYRLTPGAKVDVSGINGLLQVETSETDTAEIYIVRSVRKQEDFNQRKLIIEQQPGNHLVIRVQNDRDRSIWAMLGTSQDERQRAYLKLPRRIELDASGINGKTSIGELGGRLDLSGVNGPVKVARATGAADLSGINGNIEITLVQLTKGVEASGINGNLEMRFLGDLNAEVEIHGINGNVNAEFPNALVRQKKRGRFEARIGLGGASVDVSGINGNVTLLPATAR